MDAALADATVVSVTGTVTVRSADGSTRALHPGDTVKPGEFVRTGPDSTASIKFENGVIETLQPRSELQALPQCKAGDAGCPPGGIKGKTFTPGTSKAIRG